jgi:hypothetical protein
MKIALVVCSRLLFVSLKPGTYSSSRHFVGLKTLVHVDDVTPGTIGAASRGKLFVLQYSAGKEEFVRAAVT